MPRLHDLHDPDMVVVVGIVEGVACWDVEGVVLTADDEVGISTPLPRCNNMLD